MKIKRILSLSFILLFLTSTGRFSQLDFIDQTQTETDAQPNEDSENAVREFRESIKIDVSGTVNTRPSNLFYAANQLIFKVRHTQSMAGRTRPGWRYDLFALAQVTA